jgi:hypothetical protein
MSRPPSWTRAVLQFFLHRRPASYSLSPAASVEVFCVDSCNEALAFQRKCALRAIARNHISSDRFCVGGSAESRVHAHFTAVLVRALRRCLATLGEDIEWFSSLSCWPRAARWAGLGAREVNETSQRRRRLCRKRVAVSRLRMKESRPLCESNKFIGRNGQNVHETDDGLTAQWHTDPWADLRGRQTCLSRTSLTNCVAENR